MPSFLITDILSRETQSPAPGSATDYTTNQESLSISPITMDNNPLTNASVWLTLHHYLAQYPTVLASGAFPLSWNSCTPNRSEKTLTAQAKDGVWKTQPLLEMLYKQTSLITQSENRSPADTNDKFPWPLLPSTRPGAFHPVRRISNSGDYSARHRNSRHSPNPTSNISQPNETSTTNAIAAGASRSELSTSSLSTLNSNDTGRSYVATTSERTSGPVYGLRVDSVDLMCRGLEESSQGSGDECTGKGSRSPYGSNSALDALIHMTTSSMQRLNRKVDKPISPTDRLDLCTLTRGSQMTKRRKTRTTFSNSQLSELETNFNRQKYLTPTDRDRIAKHLGLSNTQVITWFQNRRAKLKREAEELERDILAARQQEQQKLLELHSQDSEDGTGNYGFDRMGPGERWLPSSEDPVNGTALDGSVSKSNFSKSRMDAPSPNQWSDSSPNSIPVKTSNIDNSTKISCYRTGTNSRNVLNPILRQTMNRSVVSKRKTVWSPAEELEITC
ncbi:unnamed protein product [Echinostoma caproni]|uniref:Homeobox domain-containing protein n=1 Tax=Echinostoma caproni TaxID=27848 RepID=A0A183ADJ2_9TREM|nr:unnamed protein product [Echinostoma caproni]